MFDRWLKCWVEPRPLGARLNARHSTVFHPQSTTYEHRSISHRSRQLRCRMRRLLG